MDRTIFKNRLVGEGVESPDNLAANPNNWRIHDSRQESALNAVMKEVGWVTRVIVNKRTGFVVDGHLRVALALKRKEKEVPVQYVDLDENEEAIILASFDPIGAMAGANTDILKALIEGVESSSDEVTKLLEQIQKDFELPEPVLAENYSRKIQVPIYEIKGERPSESELIDRSKTTQLVAEIEEANLPKEVERFLRIAAERHTVFLFDQIAEYYAHAPANVQDLMERSALVIVDFNKAIENGFVQLARGMMEQAAIGKVGDEGYEDED